MAPSTPPPPSSEELAALTMASTARVVMSAWRVRRRMASPWRHRRADAEVLRNQREQHGGMHLVMHDDAVARDALELRPALLRHAAARDIGGHGDDLDAVEAELPETILRDHPGGFRGHAAAGCRCPHPVGQVGMAV